VPIGWKAGVHVGRNDNVVSIDRAGACYYLLNRVDDVMIHMSVW